MRLKKRLEKVPMFSVTYKHNFVMVLTKNFSHDNTRLALFQSHSVFDHLQCAKMEGDGLGDLFTWDDAR